MKLLGITDTFKATLQSYIDWIGRVAPDVELIVMSHVRENLDALDRCDGLVLTGGGDIDPQVYGRKDAMHLVHDVNESRDAFEFAVVRRALEARIPILGICRGMQVFNVALGGTMFPDVQTAGYQNHKKEKGAVADTRHVIRIEQGTELHLIVGLTQGEVNTSHHQAVDKLGQGLRATAYSPDGLVEGLEWEQPSGRPFLQLVQWHPERMVDFENPLSRGLLDRLVSEVEASTRLQASS